MAEQNNTYYVNPKYVMYAVNTKSKTAKDLLVEGENSKKLVSLCGANSKKSVVVMCDGTILSLPVEVDAFFKKE